MDQILAPGTRLGPYEIEELIGSGGMGRVYRARDPRLSRHVAIKTITTTVTHDAELVRRFEAEARTVGALDHPNLLVVHDIGTIGDAPYLVSELLDGETLRDRVKRGPLNERVVADIALQIARGLTAAHARGVVHRDLKPENLFVTKSQRVKILDFGIAKRVKVPGMNSTTTIADTMTATGAIVGTVGYMAPEQLAGESIDARADIFALGVVLHELLTGAAPFRRESSIATMNAILTDTPPELPSTVSPVFARIVRRCLEKEPDDRFHSAHDLVLAMELVEQATSISGAAHLAPSDTHRRDTKQGAMSRRSALALGATTLLLTSIGAAGGAWFQRNRNNTPSFRRLTFRRGLIRSARVAPDGQTVLVGALWEGERCRVYTSRIDNPESSALDLPDANVLAISRNGELALALGSHRLGVITYGTLARVPLSGGAPRELATGVKFADWSPDGSELAIVRHVDGRDQLEYPVGTAIVQAKDEERTGMGFVRFSPDGKRIAFVQYRTPGSLRGRICVCDLQGNITPLTDDSVNMHGLAWRDDEILYCASTELRLFRSLLAVSPGNRPRIVSRLPGNATLWDALPDGRLVIAQVADRAVLITRRDGEQADRDLSWHDASWIADISHDGQSILFNETGLGGGTDGGAYIRPSDGGPAVRLAGGQAYALSPDGRLAICAALVTNEGVPSPHLDIVPTGAGETRRIDGKGLGFTGAGWIAPNVIVAAAHEPGRRTRLHRIDLTTQAITPISEEGVGSWVTSPDGRTIALRGIEPGITLLSVADGSRSSVAGDSTTLSPIGWINEGLLVTDSAHAGSTGAVILLNLQSGERRLWTDITPQDPAGIMVLVGFRVTPDGKTRAYTWHRALCDLYLADGLS